MWERGGGDVRAGVDEADAGDHGVEVVVVPGGVGAEGEAADEEGAAEDEEACYFGELVVAGRVSEWFFGEGDGDGLALPEVEDGRGQEGEGEEDCCAVVGGVEPVASLDWGC